VDKSLMFMRQLDIVPSDALAKLRITIIGAGAIGSYTARTLAKMGVEKLIVYDDDTVELHNLPNQGYRFGCDLGKPKVVALAEIIKEESGVTIEAKQEKFTDQQLGSGIVIAAVDSMTTRQELWKRVKYKPNVHFYIDGRMGGLLIRLYSFNPCLPQAASWYERNMLYSASEAKELPCTAQSIIFTPSMIASQIGYLIVEYLQGKETPGETVFDFVTRSMFVQLPK
jgi:molybdopterin/thiamine biosynthesis adenylyltransferase